MPTSAEDEGCCEEVEEEGGRLVAVLTAGIMRPMSSPAIVADGRSPSRIHIADGRSPKPYTYR